MKRTKTAGKSLGLKIQPLKARTLEEIEGAFASIVNERADALIINTSAETNFHRNRLTALAITKKIPTMCEQVAFVPAGCLMAYSVDRTHMLLRAAVFVDKILKGAKSKELPVEFATRYQLNTCPRTAVECPANPPLLRYHSLVVSLAMEEWWWTQSGANPSPHIFPV